MVNLYILKDHEWVHALAIPLDHLRTLSLRPYKWLRFVAFAVLGAKGHLSETPGGKVVNYENSLLTDNDNYYFTPEGDYHLVDAEAINDSITSSSVLTQRRSSFREKVSERDNNCCAITEAEEIQCDAAHIIPYSKGDEYIKFVISDRRHLYEEQQVPPESNISINSIENGIFLSKDLHALFSTGRIGFLKTPNFALSPVDIPTVETNPMPTSSRTTMQYIVPPVSRRFLVQGDALVDWSSPDAPPNILLDYLYGVAIVKRWATDDIQNTFNERRKVAFSNIPPLSHSPDVPPGDGRGRCHKSKESEMSKAMDDAFHFVMFFRGYPPQTTLADLRKEQEEEAELHSRQVGREKVQQWLSTMEASPLD